MFVLVLSDNETYTELSDCKILEVPEHVSDEDIKDFATGRMGPMPGFKVVTVFK